MKTMKTTLSALAILALTGPVFAADFTAFDANADGQVSFDEYKVIALTEGKTQTLVAQEFMRMSQGDAILTEDEFVLAKALAGQPYALQPTLINQPLPENTAPMAFEATEVVETVETSSEAIEMVEPPVETKTVKEGVPAPVIMEKPMDIDPVVAGEIETSIETTPDLVDDVTPIEDIDVPEPDIEMELETNTTDAETDVQVDPEIDEEDIESGEIY